MNRKSFLKASLCGVVGNLIFPTLSHGHEDFIPTFDISKIHSTHIVSLKHHKAGDPIAGGLNFAFSLPESKSYKVENLISNDYHIDSLIIEFAKYWGEFPRIDDIWGATLQRSANVPFGSIVLLARNDENQVEYFMLNGLN